MSRRARPLVPSRQRQFQRDMSVARQEWRFEVGSPDQGERLDAFLAGRLRWRSRSQVQRLIAAGRVEINEVNGHNRADAVPAAYGASGDPRPSTRLRAGQEIVLWLDAAQEEEAYRELPSTEIEVVYEDRLLLAVNKPPRMNLYPSRRHRGGSLIELVHRQALARANGREAGAAHGNSHPPSPCHRLDRETSGLVLFAKDPATRAAVGAQLEARTVRKSYLALVIGEVAPDEGAIDLALGPDPRSRVEIRRAAVPSGEPARTRFRVLERFGGRTLVELLPLTGRQHQLRVHMAAIGHPIVGDKLYLGGDDLFLRSLEGKLDETDRALLGLDRQALHALRLELDHPHRCRITIEAPLWPDVAALIRLLVDQGTGLRAW